MTLPPNMAQRTFNSSKTMYRDLATRYKLTLISLSASGTL
jgi:hypothetical protein